MMEHCHEAVTEAPGHILAVTLFLGALVGSITHCVGMCGPFVLAQVSGFSTPEGKKSTWYRQLLLPYHLGRLTTYTALGTLVSAIAVPLLKIHALKMAAPILLALAGVVFLASAFSQVMPVKYLNFSFCDVPQWITKHVAPLLPSNSFFSAYVLGILLGFLPCGLVYGAIMAAATTGNVLESAIAMMAFAFGTMPVLILISLGGKLLLNKQYSWIKIASAVLMLFNSLMLFTMAGKFI